MKSSGSDARVPAGGVIKTPFKDALVKTVRSKKG